ncbi:MAG: DUF6065 family protein [Aliidongia sp.]
MRLICYATSGPQPRIVTAPLERDWMDQTPQGYAYRCLPLNIANSHGWLILNPAPFTAQWNGGPGAESVSIVAGAGATQPILAMSHFGNGVLTISVTGLFRTEPGWDLWVGGPVNMIKDGIQPLTAMVETDWSPFTFTMNYKFTRPLVPVVFGQDEPYCMIFPVKRGAVEAIQPEFRALSDDPEVEAAFAAWAERRRNFNTDLQVAGSAAQQQKWQKDYFRGANPWGTAPPDHRTKVKLKEFK